MSAIWLENGIAATWEAWEAFKHHPLLYMWLALGAPLALDTKLGSQGKLSQAALELQSQVCECTKLGAGHLLSWGICSHPSGPGQAASACLLCHLLQAEPLGGEDSLCSPPHAHIPYLFCYR